MYPMTHIKLPYFIKIDTESLPEHLVHMGVVTMRREVEVAWHTINCELTNYSTASFIVKLLANILSNLILRKSFVIVNLAARYYMADKSLADVHVMDL
jgi:hypothetical protein